MNAADIAVPDDWLGYRDCLPLSWQPLAAPLAGWQLDRHADENLRVLGAIAAIDERHPMPDADEAMQAELARLHQKLDLVLGLVGSLLRMQQAVPPPVALWLSRLGVCWTGLPGAGEGMLTLHLHASVPQAFTWPATLEPGPSARARFHAMPEVLATALERHVFIRHRRSVAESRQPVRR